MVSHTAGFARMQIKERERAFRAHWPLFGAVTFGLCTFSAGLLWAVSSDMVVPVWMIGPVFSVAVMGASKTQFDGTYNLRSGIDAEEWTSRDLRKALGPAWYVIDGISFGSQGDVDHVAVGPSGVFVIETKYTDSDMASGWGRSTISSWVEQSREGARRVRLLLKHNYGHVLDVSPVVVVSGTESLELPKGLEGTDIFRRRHLRRLTDAWNMQNMCLNSSQVESIRAALLDYRGLREDFDRR